MQGWQVGAIVLALVATSHTCVASSAGSSHGSELRGRARQGAKLRSLRPVEGALRAPDMIREAIALKEAPIEGSLASNALDDDDDHEDEDVGADDADDEDSDREDQVLPEHPWLAAPVRALKTEEVGGSTEKKARAVSFDVERKSNESRDAAGEDKYDTALSADAGAVAKEMESPALAKFLKDLRLEVRAVYEQVKDRNASNATTRRGSYVKDKKAEGASRLRAVEKEEGGQAGKSTGEVEWENAGTVFAIGMFSQVVVLSVVFGMASSSKKQVADFTWFTVDQVVAIFVAVMWFQSFDGLLDFGGFAASHRIVMSCVHATAVLLCAIALAYLLREREVGLAILCGCGAHYVAFASMHAGTELQVGFFLDWWYHPVSCVVGILVLCMGLAAVGAGVFLLKRHARLTEEEAFMEKTDDMENDFAAMAVALLFSLLVRFLITGHHPQSEEVEFDHTAFQREVMFLYACIAIAAAGAGVMTLSRIRGGSLSYGVRRACMFGNAFLAMNAAWAWLLWGEWEFYEGKYTGSQPLFGRVLFGLAVSLVCAGMVLAMGHVPLFAAHARMVKVMLTAMSLVVGWAWEACFDDALEKFCDGLTHPVVAKVAATVVISAVLLPVYATSMKPIAMKAAEDMEG